MAHHLLFSGKGEPGSPEGLAIIHAAHIMHRPWVNIGSEGHPIPSGFFGPPDDPICDKVRVSPGGPDDSSCCFGSSCLARPH